jgi:hypothetical protein
MKNFKAWMISLVVMIFVMVTCGCICAQADELDRGEFYPKLAVVIHVETIENTNIITCEDGSRSQWAFFDDEDYYKEGDIVNLLMWNLNEHEEDDEIVEVYREGHIDNLNLFFETIKGE